MFVTRPLVLDKGLLNPDLGGIADWLLFIACILERGGFFLPKYLGHIQIHPGGYLATTLSEKQGLEEMAISYLKSTSGDNCLPRECFLKIKQRIRHNRIRINFTTAASIGKTEYFGLMLRFAISISATFFLYRFKSVRLIASKFLEHRRLHKTVWINDPKQID